MNPNNENMNADLVVIGAGGAGLSAAVAAAEKNVNVVVLEKRNMPGGRSLQAEGFFAAESPVQERMGIDANRDVLFNMAMDYAHWRIDPRIIRAFINKSGDTVRWLEKKGVRIDTVSPFYRNQKILTWHQPKKGGVEIIDALVKNCQSLGVRLFSQTSAKKIVINSREKMNTVVAGTSDKELIINTKTIIFATGGYGGNKEMLKKYCSFYIDQMGCSNSTFNSGDGLSMAVEAGAATEGLGLLHIMGPRYDGNNSHISVICQEPDTMWVNKLGERFTDESTAMNHYESVNALLQQPDRISYALIDEQIKQRLIMNGPVKIRLGVFYGLKKEDIANLDREIQNESGIGKIKISGSWDEIANWIGAPNDTLGNEINQYNQSCESGYDNLFNKNREYLAPLRTPPYYAIKCRTAIIGSIGGIKVNQHMQVIDQHYAPIRGLYAAGTDVGGWESDTYNAHLSGTSFGFPLNSGRIAGEHAARYTSERCLQR